jgi:hypothetical protein
VEKLLEVSTIKQICAGLLPRQSLLKLRPRPELFPFHNSDSARTARTGRCKVKLHFMGLSQRQSARRISSTIDFDQASEVRSHSPERRLTPLSKQFIRLGRWEAICILDTRRFQDYSSKNADISSSTIKSSEKA